MLSPIDAVRLIKLPYYLEESGDLVVMEALTHVPFPIARVFVVRAPAGAIRGRHAHKACAQFLACPVGTIEVSCDDGTGTVDYVLDRPDMGLLIPPGIWARQTYRMPGTVLLVLCDRPYEDADYIRDYADFKAYRKSVSVKQR